MIWYILLGIVIGGIITIPNYISYRRKRKARAEEFDRFLIHTLKNIECWDFKLPKTPTPTITSKTPTPKFKL